MTARRNRWILGLTIAQLSLLIVTFPVPGFGAETWHHMASLAAVLGLTGLLWSRLISSRRALALGLLVTSVLASVSGFYLIYWKAGIRVEGFQDWGVWWHVAWSWMVMVLFALHTWVNRVSFVRFFQDSLRSRLGTWLHLGAYLIVLAALVATWSPWGRDAFTNANYIPYTLRTWVLVLVPPYLAWLWVRRRQRTGEDPLARFGHWPVRRAVDLALVPTTALAILSGLPLIFDGPIDPRGLKYVAKYWHVWPSILFTVLVFIHAVQAWPTVKVHWGKLLRERR
ncbi:MAG: hypothetical protein R3185_08420 [Candidatus Thermoplasmatota archaeon]|nr:hypothetical protein [Candidatus Thermoplasmatota archaeon]